MCPLPSSPTTYILEDPDRAVEDPDRAIGSTGSFRSCFSQRPITRCLQSFKIVSRILGWAANSYIIESEFLAPGFGNKEFVYCHALAVIKHRVVLKKNSTEDLEAATIANSLIRAGLASADLPATYMPAGLQRFLDFEEWSSQKSGGGAGAKKDK